MKKFILFVTVFLISHAFTFSQTNICEFDESFSNPSPTFTSWLNQVENDYQAYISGGGGGDGNTAVIPTVVHVFYVDPVNDIEDDIIQQVLDKVNDDLAGEQGGHNTGISLALATIDEDGNCTSGIRHVEVNSSVNFSNNKQEWTPLSTWDNDSYLNIWVAPNTASFIANSSLPFPTFGSTLETDGIAIRNEIFLNALDDGHEFEEALTHEAGHYFGLYHVWGTSNGQVTCAAGCHSEADDLTRGDRVGDTNQCRSPIIFNDCDPYTTDCNGCPVDMNLPYPKENFMSYARFCKTEFTEGQCDRMWFFLENFRDLLNSNANQICTGAPIAKLGHNIEVTGVENWTTESILNNGVVTITGDLIIKSGGELTIGEGVELYFCQDGRMIIERGGTCINNGRLTNACGTQWKGITVYGNSSVAPGNYFSHPEQGLFICNQGSIIENAEIGVTLSGPSFTSESGGMFGGTGAAFINNTTSILIPPYALTGNYPARFNNCNFQSDGQFSFSSFVDLNDVKGVRFDGCDFTYIGPSYGFGIDGYGYGIWAKSSGFLMESSSITDKFGNPTGVDRCRFSGLGYGIHITNTIGNKPFEIVHAEFDNCYVGVYDGGMSVGKIVYNDFNLGTVPDPTLISADDQSQIGLFVQGSLIAIELQENNFLSSGSFPFNITGVIADNIGTHDNYIRKNTYSDCLISNLATRYNGGAILGGGDGLRYQCNDMWRSAAFDITVPEEDINGNPLNSQVNEEQATYDEFENILSAGNLFSFIDNPVGQFSNQGDEIDYYYELGVFREEPIQFEGLNKLDANQAECSEEFCPPPCDIIIATPGPGGLGPTVTGFNDDKDDYDDAYNDYTDGNTSPQDSTALEDEMTALVTSMDGATDFALFTLAQDSTGSYFNDYLWWIGQQDSYEADIWLASEYANTNDWTMANSILNGLPTKYNLQGAKYAEWQATQSIFNIIQSDGLSAISTSNLNSLQSIVIQQLGNASILANNLLYLNGDIISPTYYMPDVSSIRPRNSDKQTLANNYKITPNPSSGVFTISWEASQESEIMVSLFSTNGNLLQSTPLQKGEQFDISEYPSGIYYINLVSQSSDSETHKLLKID